MKKIISYVLLLSLALTIVVSMPSRQVMSAPLANQQMTQLVGGDVNFGKCAANVVIGGLGGLSAGMGVVGATALTVAAVTPMGWFVIGTFVAVGYAAGAYNGCGGAEGTPDRGPGANTH